MNGLRGKGSRRVMGASGAGRAGQGALCRDLDWQGLPDSWTVPHPDRCAPSGCRRWTLLREAQSPRGA